MRADVQRDLSRSARDFSEVVWPVIRARCRGGLLIAVESDDDSNAKAALDVLAGIDAWQVAWSDGRMRGIASRIQWIKPKADPYNTFTVRYRRPGSVKTEIQKRVEAMRDPGAWLLPALTVQAYLCTETRAVRSIGVVDTRAFYTWLEANDRFFSEIRNIDGSSTFKAIPWSVLIDEGLRVAVFNPVSIAASGVNNAAPDLTGDSPTIRARNRGVNA